MSDMAYESADVVPGRSPHGGELIDLVLKGSQLQELKARSIHLKSYTLSRRQLCDIELLLNGGFSPLRQFMNKSTYESVVETMRLPSGLLFPMPITLDLPKAKVDEFLQDNETKEIALRDEEGSLIAVMKVEETWQPDLSKEAQFVFGSTNIEHPGVAYLLRDSGDTYLSGPLWGAQLPVHYDYAEFRRTPLEARLEFAKRGWTKIVGFQTRNPMHRAHRELTVRATQVDEGDGVPIHLFLHPVVGLTKPGDIDYHTRVKCYKTLMSTYPAGLAMLSLNPLAMRMGGPREALWHAIIRKNFGCTHFIVGRDHAGPGSDSKGVAFYHDYAAQKAALEHAKELDVKVLPFQMMVYVESHDKYYPENEIPKGEKSSNISGTKLRELLRTGGDIPEWFTYPEVVKILRQTTPPRVLQGFTVFFTGLSGAGKSTIANALREALLAEGNRQVTLLDGDLVRTLLSAGLGFSKEDRDLNIKRIGYVASEITKCRGIAICAPIAPYEDTRRQVRELILQHGGFIEVHISTPLQVCEQRDKKGLYKKARAGLITHFTGIDDPYEPPSKPEIRLDTSSHSVKESVETILNHLRTEGFIVN